MEGELSGEYRAAVEGVAWARVDTAVLMVQGPDRVKWLHKMITANIEGRGAGQGVRSALLDAKGHFVGDFVVLPESDRVTLLTEPGAREALLSALRRYIIREKVRIEDDSQRMALVTLIGPDADRMATRVWGISVPASVYHFVPITPEGDSGWLVRSWRARVPSIDLLLPASAQDSPARQLGKVPALSPEVLEILRIEAGIPRWGADFDEDTLALEIPDVMQIRVDQGCYVGQEVVARLVHRGHVNRHLRALYVENDYVPPRGDPIWHEDKAVGAVTSSAYSPILGAVAMGYVRREVPIGATVRVGEGRASDARVVELPSRGEKALLEFKD